MEYPPISFYYNAETSLSPAKIDEISQLFKGKKPNQTKPTPPLMLNPTPPCLPQLSHSLEAHYTSRSSFPHWPALAQLQHLLHSRSSPTTCQGSQTVLNSNSFFSSLSTFLLFSLLHWNPSHHLPSLLTMCSSCYANQQHVTSLTIPSFKKYPCLACLSSCVISEGFSCDLKMFIL